MLSGAVSLCGAAPWPAWPVFDERDEQAVTEVVRSGQWGGHPYPGPKTRDFLERFATMQGGGYPVAVANGTQSLEIALRTAGIGWGDEVIVPAYTFAATATGPMAAGAIPVIVDIDPATFCMDPRAAEAAITPRTWRSSRCTWDSRWPIWTRSPRSRRGMA